MGNHVLPLIGDLGERAIVAQRARVQRDGADPALPIRPGRHQMPVELQQRSAPASSSIVTAIPAIRPSQCQPAPLAGGPSTRPRCRATSSAAARASTVACWVASTRTELAVSASSSSSVMLGARIRAARLVQ